MRHKCCHSSLPSPIKCNMPVPQKKGPFNRRAGRYSAEARTQAISSSGRPCGSTPRRDLSRDSAHQGATRRPPYLDSRSSRGHHSPLRRRDARRRSPEPRQPESSSPSQARSYSEYPSYLDASRYLSKRSRSHAPLSADRSSTQTSPSYGPSDINRVLH